MGDHVVALFKGKATHQQLETVAAIDPEISEKQMSVSIDKTDFTSEIAMAALESYKKIHFEIEKKPEKAYQRELDLYL